LIFLATLKNFTLLEKKKAISAFPKMAFHFFFSG